MPSYMPKRRKCRHFVLVSKTDSIVLLFYYSMSIVLLGEEGSPSIQASLSDSCPELVCEDETASLSDSSSLSS